MIVDPDFLDHWRTRMVVDALGGDELAPLYVIRLWAHCQNRKSDSFAMPPAGLKALCKYQGDADALESALIAADYIVREGDQLTVVGWSEKNASLIAAWENGNRGGRPKKPMGNPQVTHGLPMGNPAVTHGEPMENPTLTQAKPIREEKRREESSSLRSEDKGAGALSVADLVAEGVDLQDATDWLRARKDKGAKTLTLTAWESVKSEASKAGMTPAQAVSLSAKEQWRGFKASWLSDQGRGNTQARVQPKNAKHGGFEEKDYTAGVMEDGTIV